MLAADLIIKLYKRYFRTCKKFVPGTMPVKFLPYKNRVTTWVKPVLVAEIKFAQWTEEGIMRAPIFLRFRSDKRPEECTLVGRSTCVD